MWWMMPEALRRQEDDWRSEAMPADYGYGPQDVSHFRGVGSALLDPVGGILVGLAERAGLLDDGTKMAWDENEQQRQIDYMAGGDPNKKAAALGLAGFLGEMGLGGAVGKGARVVAKGVLGQAVNPKIAGAATGAIEGLAEGLGETAGYDNAAGQTAAQTTLSALFGAHGARGLDAFDEAAVLRDLEVIAPRNPSRWAVSEAQWDKAIPEDDVRNAMSSIAEDIPNSNLQWWRTRESNLANKAADARDNALTYLKEKGVLPEKAISLDEGWDDEVFKALPKEEQNAFWKLYEDDLDASMDLREFMVSKSSAVDKRLLDETYSPRPRLGGSDERAMRELMSSGYFPTQDMNTLRSQSDWDTFMWDYLSNPRN